MPSEIIKQRIQYLIETGALDDPSAELRHEVRRALKIAVFVIVACTLADIAAVLLTG